MAIRRDMHSFAEVPSVDIPRSKFDRSFPHKFTADAGWLIPFYWDMVLPGDTFSGNTTVFGRMSTPLYPLVDSIYCDVHFFYCPTRLLWDNFKKFCGEQVDPGDSIDYQIPILADNSAATYKSDADINYGSNHTRAGIVTGKH